jgi:hypothetical protein
VFHGDRKAGPYCELCESSLHPHTLVLWDQLSFHLSLRMLSDLFLSNFETKMCVILHIPSVAALHSHLIILFQLSNSIWRIEESIKLLFMQFSASSCYVNVSWVQMLSQPRYWCTGNVTGDFKWRSCLVTTISTSVALCYAASLLDITGNFRRAFCQSVAVCTPQPLLWHVLPRCRCVDVAAARVTCPATASLCGRRSSYDNVRPDTVGLCGRHSCQHDM